MYTFRDVNKLDIPQSSSFRYGCAVFWNVGSLFVKKKKIASKGNGKEWRWGGGGVGNPFRFCPSPVPARPKAIWNGNPQTLRSLLTNYYNIK